MIKTSVVRIKRYLVTRFSKQDRKQEVVTANNYAWHEYKFFLSEESVNEKRHHKTILADVKWPFSLNIVTLLFLALFMNCRSNVLIGVKNDFNTGLSASYKNMEPQKVFLVMHSNVLYNNEIPLGESFIVMNEGIKGVVVKNGEVAIGCMLQITNSKGELLLNEKDLFEGHDVFNKDQANLLQCTINTGAPMLLEEEYNILVLFWDKNGNGKIENKVTIRMINSLN